MIINKSFLQYKKNLVNLIPISQRIDFDNIIKNGLKESNIVTEKHFFESPSFSITDWVETKIAINESINLNIYITDWKNTEYVYNRYTKYYLLEINKNGEKIIRKILKGGNNTLTLEGFSTTGEYYYSFQVTDLENNIKSYKEVLDLYVIDDNYNIKDNEIYTMTESDLSNYSIDNSNNQTESIRIANSLNITKFLKEKKDAGFRKVLMLPGIYRIDPQGNPKNAVTIPNGLTLDGNGCTIKQHVYYDPKSQGNSLILNCEDNSFDTHLLNIKVEGDYDVHDLSQRYDSDGNKIGNGIEGEGFGGITFGGSFCTMDNVELSLVTGYCFGGGGVTIEASKLLGNNDYENGFIDLKTGEKIDSLDSFVSPIIDLSKMDYSLGWMNPVDGRNKKFIGCGAYGGYQGFTGQSDLSIIVFYDENNNYLGYEKLLQYTKVPLINNARYARAIFLGNEKNRNLQSWGCKLYCINYLYNTSTKITNFYCHDTRTCLTYPTYNRVLIKNCRFDKVAKEDEHKVTKWLFDNEDGSYWGHGFYFIDNKVENLTSAGFNMIHSYNCVFKNSNIPITKWQSRNMIIENCNCEITVWNSHGPYGSNNNFRFLDKEFTNDIIIRTNNEYGLYEYRNYKDKIIINGCKIINGKAISECDYNNGFYNCTITPKHNSTAGPNRTLNGYFKNCSINLDNNSYALSGIFEKCDVFNEGSIGSSIAGNLTFKNCNVNNINNISTNEDAHSVCFNSCNINNSYCKMAYWSIGKDMSFINCKINCDSSFYYIANYSTYKPLLIDRCEITINDGYVLYFGDDRSWTPSDTSLTKKPFSIKNSNIRLKDSNYAINLVKNDSRVNELILNFENNQIITGKGMYDPSIEEDSKIKIITN